MYKQLPKYDFEVKTVDQHAKEELEEALEVVSSMISKCEKIQPKFAEGTSQHSLLKNRIKAMYIAKSLIRGENVADQYTKAELIDALRPVLSIIRKCEKAQSKYDKGTSHHTRFENIIKTMYTAKAFIEDEINRRD